MRKNGGNKGSGDGVSCAQDRFRCFCAFLDSFLRPLLSFHHFVARACVFCNTKQDDSPPPPRRSKAKEKGKQPDTREERKKERKKESNRQTDKRERKRERK